MGHRKQRIIVSTACVLVEISCGLCFTWSVFQDAVTAQFGWDPIQVSMVSSVIIMVNVLAVLMSGFLQDRLGPRLVTSLGAVFLFIAFMGASLIKGGPVFQIYLLYGIPLGMGCGFAYSGTIHPITAWNEDHRGVASGILLCAGGVSLLLYTNIMTALLAHHTFTQTVRILGCITPVVVFLLAQLIRKPPESPAQPDGAQTETAHAVRQYTPGEMLRTREYWCIALTIFLQGAGYMMINPFIKTLGILRGLSEAQATLTLSVVAIANILSRLGVAALSDKVGRLRAIIGCTVLMLLSAVCMIFANGVAYIVAVFLVCCAYNGPMAVFPALSAELFGTEHSGTNWGLTFMFTGISSVVFTRLGTALSADGLITGHFTKSFLLAGVLCLIPLVLQIVFRNSLRPENN